MRPCKLIRHMALIPHRVTTPRDHPVLSPLGRRSPLRESEGYREDFIGLRSLDEAKKLRLLTYKGDHLAFTPDFWAKEVLPHLGP